MSSKTRGAIALVVVLIVGAIASTASATSSSTTCSYRLTGLSRSFGRIVFTVSGRDNTWYFCGKFNGGLKGAPTSEPSRYVVGRWASSSDLDVRLTISASDRMWGKLYVGMFDRMVSSKHLPFTRVA
jgi:hypothetical protein